MYGVIDIGSNTIRMMIYRIENGALKPVLNNKYPAGLVGYVSAKGKLSREGIEKAVEILSELKLITEQLSLDTIYPFATASLRNITNSAEVLRAIHERTGFDIRLLSGEEEARFDYYGAIQSATLKSGVVTDVGGGSAELVFFRKNEIAKAVSIPVGSLKLYTRHVSGILPSRREIRTMEQELDRELANLSLPFAKYAKEQLCAVGGTARAALKLYNKLEGHPAGASFPADFFDDYISQIEMGPERLTALILKLAPERIHTLTPGIVILRRIARMSGADTITTSFTGVREGYLSSILSERGEL